VSVKRGRKVEGVGVMKDKEVRLEGIETLSKRSRHHLIILVQHHKKGERYGNIVTLDSQNYDSQ
jgi:hypothetical protein